MKLSKKQRELFEKKLLNIENKVCTICHSRTLIASDTIFELREFNGGNLILGGPSSALLPLVVVVCPNCGNTHFFNAITLGLVKKDNEGVENG